MALNLYTPDGWLDFKSIYETGMTFIFIIGSRQVGKTFGGLKYMTENEKKMVFMRRSASELEFAVSNSEASIFSKMASYLGCSYTHGKVNQYINTLTCTKDGKDIDLGISTALTSLGHIRGFNGDPYEVIFYDEFIPEVQVKKMSGEGAAFVNGYITLNGNRELEGRPPLRAVLLANANTLDSPILSEFNLTQKVESMVKSGQEYSLMPERGILIVMPKSEKITGERAKTALYLATGTESDAAKMALNNQFSYNDFTDVRHVTVDAAWNCIFVYKKHYVYRHKVDGTYYCCPKKSGSPHIIWTMRSVGLKKHLVEIGQEQFIIDHMMHKLIYSSYEEKTFWEDSLYVRRK